MFVIDRRWKASHQKWIFKNNVLAFRMFLKIIDLLLKKIVKQVG
jgi:hypothetical protein